MRCLPLSINSSVRPHNSLLSISPCPHPPLPLHSPCWVYYCLNHELQAWTETMSNPILQIGPSGWPGWPPGGGQLTSGEPWAVTTGTGNWRGP